MLSSQLPFSIWRDEKQVPVLRRVVKGLQTKARCFCRRERALVLLCDSAEDLFFLGSQLKCFHSHVVCQ